MTRVTHHIELIDLFSVDAAVEIRSVSKHPPSNDGKYVSKIGNIFLIPYHIKKSLPKPNNVTCTYVGYPLTA